MPPISGNPPSHDAGRPHGSSLSFVSRVGSVFVSVDSHPVKNNAKKQKYLCAIRPQFIKKNGGNKSAVKFHFIFAALRGTSSARQKLNISWECLCRPFRAIRLPMMPGVPTAARCRLSRASGASSSPSIRTQSKTMPKTKILSNIS